MKILLTKDVSGLGRTGDIKDVSDGYARNYLLPRHLALPATQVVLGHVQKQEQEHQAKIKKTQEHHEQLVKRLKNQIFTVKAKSDKGHLFAAIKENQIAEAIAKKTHVSLEPNQIIIQNPIKTAGEHQIEIALAQNITFNVKLTVEAD